MPLGSFRRRPQKPDPKFQPQIVCATLCHPIFSMVDRLVIEVTRTTGRVVNSRMGPAVPLNRFGEEKDGQRHLIDAIADKCSYKANDDVGTTSVRCSPPRTVVRITLDRYGFTATHPQALHRHHLEYVCLLSPSECSTRIDVPAPRVY